MSNSYFVLLMSSLLLLSIILMSLSHYIVLLVAKLIKADKKLIKQAKILTYIKQYPAENKYHRELVVGGMSF